MGASFYVDPPTEILQSGTADDRLLWRLSHIGVDSHAIHFHLFNVQVVNRVDWTNTIKPPYPDELGWKETIRTNPFEDIIVAIKPAAMTLPFTIPNSNRLLDPTMPLGSTANFTPVAPPPGTAAVAGTTNVPTNFGWEYVWHCHLLGHEENDMMRPIVFQPAPPSAVAPPSLTLNAPLGSSASTTMLVANGALTGGQSLALGVPTITPATATQFSIANDTCSALAPQATCGMLVSFTAPATAGSYAATLAIPTTDPARPTLNVSLTGTSYNPLAPAIPASFSAIGTVAGKNRDNVTLSWTQPSGNPVTSYTLQRATNGAFTSNLNTSTIAGNLLATLQTGLTPKTTYYYRLSATNASGASGWVTTSVKTP